jgi:hypothetical protein
MRRIVVFLVLLNLLIVPLALAADPVLTDLAQEILKIENTLRIMIQVHDNNVEIFQARFDNIETRLNNLEHHFDNSNELKVLDGG